MPRGTVHVLDKFSTEKLRFCEYLTILRKSVLPQAFSESLQHHITTISSSHVLSPELNTLF